MTNNNELKQNIIDHIIGCNKELEQGNEWFDGHIHNQSSMEAMELVLNWMGVTDEEIKQWKESHYAKTYYR